jgi:GPH family glycoside/pentoside/hexuronide:cation symporter
MHKKPAYAAPAFALAVVGIPVYIYIPKFYTDVVGIDMIVISYMILGARVFDALPDPIIGSIYDATGTKFGRRRPCISLGYIFLALAIYFLFNPIKVSPNLENLWFGIWIFYMFFLWAIVAVPYESFGPELTFDYHERTTPFSLRDGALIIGTLVAAGSPVVVTKIWNPLQDFSGESAKFFRISMLYCPLIIPLCLWCVAAIREKDRIEMKGRKGSCHGFSQNKHNRSFIL